MGTHIADDNMVDPGNVTRFDVPLASDGLHRSRAVVLRRVVDDPWAWYMLIP